MDSLIITSTEDTPEINFDTVTGIFKISGRSLPENAIEFFEPVLQWLNKYISTPKDRTILEFNLEYFNTASAKQIAKILKTLESLAENHSVLIRWNYNKIDSDMLSSGKRYAQLIKIHFEFIELD